MATTTNFGWTTPDDTDLVKDGASAIRTLGSAIDTSLVDLKGGTTGQVLSKASNTDMDFSWIAAGGAPASAQGAVTTYESTTSTSYTGFTTSTAVTLTTGTKALVIHGAEEMNSNGAETKAFISFAISGATTSAADDTRAFTLTTTTNSNRPKIGGSRAILVTGLTAGSNTFTQQIKTSSAGASAGAQNRNILVIDMGS